MYQFFKSILLQIAGKMGFKITPMKDGIIKDMSEEQFLNIYQNCKGISMASTESLYSLYKAIEYIIKGNIPGDFVECGVWKGGVAMLMAFTATKLKDKKRKIYLFDTFQGMTLPGKFDALLSDNTSAKEIYKNSKKKEKDSYTWCYADLNSVKSNLSSTKYPKKNLIFVEGDVQQTLKQKNNLPKAISILRLDTDFFESTKIELETLYPRLSIGGVVIIDDYGTWTGTKKACDDYFAGKNILFHRIDNSCRIGVKINSCD